MASRAIRLLSVSVAAAGVDFVYNSSSIVYIAGEGGIKSITVQVCDDAVAEGDEIFNVDVATTSGGDGAEGANLVALANIPVTIDDDDLFTISDPTDTTEGGASVLVGNAGTGAAPGAPGGNTLTFAVGRNGSKRCYQRSVQPRGKRRRHRSPSG